MLFLARDRTIADAIGDAIALNLAPHWCHNDQSRCELYEAFDPTMSMNVECVLA